MYLCIYVFLHAARLLWYNPVSEIEYISVFQWPLTVYEGKHKKTNKLMFIKSEVSQCNT